MRCSVSNVAIAANSRVHLLRFLAAFGMGLGLCAIFSVYVESLPNAASLLAENIAVVLAGVVWLLPAICAIRYEWWTVSAQLIYCCGVWMAGVVWSFWHEAYVKDVHSVFPFREIDSIISIGLILMIPWGVGRFIRWVSHPHE